jgi:hypothetical protein
MEPEEIGAPEIVKALNVPYRTVLGWLQQNQLPSRRDFNGRRFVRVADLRAFLAVRAQEGRVPPGDLEAYLLCREGVEASTTQS